MKKAIPFGALPGVMLPTFLPVIVCGNNKPVAVWDDWLLLTAFISSWSENYWDWTEATVTAKLRPILIY